MKIALGIAAFALAAGCASAPAPQAASADGAIQTAALATTCKDGAEIRMSPSGPVACPKPHTGVYRDASNQGQPAAPNNAQYPYPYEDYRHAGMLIRTGP